MHNFDFSLLKHRLVVSCQAEPPSPFDNPEDVTKFAICARMGGAAGIRTCGVQKARAIMEAVDLPVIGLTKAKFPDGTVCITGCLEDVRALIDSGVDIVAVDGTFRLREGGLTGPQYIARLRSIWPDKLFMADISTFDEALACRKAGADCVSTTLAGYTPQTLDHSCGGPSLDLLKRCSEGLDCPIFAEGRYNTPADAASALQCGAHAVVVGSAITRPHLITEWFVKALDQ